MNLIEHAKSEFKRLGYKDIEDCEEDPDKWIQENVIELIEVFSKQGHSGFSAPFCISYFEKLAQFKILTPITGEENEWTDVGHCFQNKYLSSVFKNYDGTCTYLEAIIWKNQDGSCFTGEVENLKSSQKIKFPFFPKTFYIDVIETELGIKIKDKSQLVEVFEYYIS